ncbi:MAG: DUF4012 domain-containing protein [Acidimicrobiales bacterium]
MRTAWVVPLLVALAVGLAATPLARRLALSSGLVDRPASNKSHRRVMPYLGGVAIAVAVLVGTVAGHPSPTGAIVACFGTVLVVVGLADDSHPVSPGLRLLVETGCAVAVMVLAGVRLHGTGVPALGIVATLVLLVGIANSVNLLDNLDGLAAGVTASGAAGVMVLGILGGHAVTITTSAALLGACLAFLVFNAPPASIFMGDAGSLFLGFVLAAVTIREGARMAEPASLVVPLLVLALPIADTLTVFVARVHNRRSPLTGGKDHLSHRLAALGLGSVKSVALLVGVEAAMSALAVLAGRRVIPLAAAVVAGVILMTLLVTVAGRARVYRDNAIGFPRFVWWLLGGLVALLIAMPIPAVLGALGSRGPALAGEVAAENAVAAAQVGHLRTAAADFAAARVDFARASAALGGPLASMGLIYPVLSSNLQDARLVARVGEALASVGEEVASTTDRFRYQVRGGAVPIAELASTTPSLTRALVTIDSSLRLLGSESHSYLLSPVAHACALLKRQLLPARHRILQAIGIATYLPPLFGLHGPQRYFLAMQDNSEQRATGGFIGFEGLLLATGGHLRLTALDPIAKLNRNAPLSALQAPPGYLARYASFDPSGTWQNINMSPDFPTVGSVITHLYPKSGGVPVNGVIGVDPVALAGFLQLTGPVKVAGWPVPITSANVVRIVLQKAYIAYGSAEAARQAFLARLARDVFVQMSHVSIRDPRQLISVLAPIVAAHHLQIYSSSPATEAWLSSLGLTGAIPPVRSDMVQITTQNAAGNKIDYYLHRSLSYAIQLSPIASSPGGVPSFASARANVSVTLHNTAPASGLPSSIIGPFEPGYVAGENRTFFTLYTPLGFSSATVGSTPSGLQSTSELGRWADSTFLDIPARSSVTCHVSLVGSVRLLKGGWYELTLGSQPLVWPDHVTVSVSVAPGWSIGAVRGAQRVGAASAAAAFSMDSTRQIWVKLVRAG